LHASRQIPRLRREDHHDGRELESHVAGREQRHQPQHEPGEKAEHWDALQDVEHRQEQAFCHAGPGRSPPESEREQIRDHEGHHAARERIQRVPGERGRAQVDLYGLHERRLEFAGERNHGRNHPAHEAKDGDVSEPEARWQAKRLHAGTNG